MKSDDNMVERVATIADPEGNTVFLMADAMRDSILPYIDPVQPHHSMSLAMTAAATFAGMQIGQLIAIGVARDQDKKRMVDTMVRNIRQGIDLGKKNTFRAAEALAGEAGHA